MFEEEKPHLQALPLLGMQCFTEAQRTVRDDSFVRVHHSSYAERPRTVVLPDDERVFNPSRETRHVLALAKAIGADAGRLCELLFAIEGRPCPIQPCAA